MKKILLVILVIAGMTSCHKTKMPPSCTISLADMAGTYKLTKLEAVSYDKANVQDLTNTLTGCELSGIYTFNANGTAAYAEPGACSSNSSGTWSVNKESSGFTAPFNPGNRGVGTSATLITSWDCTNLQLMTMYPTVSFNLRFTLTKL